MESKALSKRKSVVFGVWTGLVLFPFFGLIQGAMHGVKAGMWVVMSLFPAYAWYGVAAQATKLVFMLGGVFMALVLLPAVCAAAWWAGGYCMDRLTVPRGIKVASYAKVD